MTRPARRIGAALAVLALVVTMTTACTSDEDRFCGRLRDDYRLDSLVRAIELRDQKAITADLRRLRELQDVAPKEIHDEFRALVDAVSGAVRAVTGATGPEGQDEPVDLTLLGQQLKDVREPAQQVADYADRSCGLKLNP